jgi:hypothetical protein
MRDALPCATAVSAVWIAWPVVNVEVPYRGSDEYGFKSPFDHANYQSGDLLQIRKKHRRRLLFKKKQPSG